MSLDVNSGNLTKSHAFRRIKAFFFSMEEHAKQVCSLSSDARWSSILYKSIEPFMGWNLSVFVVTPPSNLPQRRWLTCKAKIWSFLSFLWLSFSISTLQISLSSFWTPCPAALTLNSHESNTEHENSDSCRLIKPSSFAPQTHEPVHLRWNMTAEQACHESLSPLTCLCVCSFIYKLPIECSEEHECVIVRL